MTLPVVVHSNQKSRGSIRGTFCSPGNSASSGLAHLNSEKPTHGHSSHAREHLRIESALVRGRALLSTGKTMSSVINPARTFSGDPRIKPCEQSLRGLANGLQPNLSFANAPELHGHLSKGVDAACAKKLSHRSMS